MARVRAEAEAAHRWARYAEDLGPEDDGMPDVADESDDDHDNVSPMPCSFLSVAS